MYGRPQAEMEQEAGELSRWQAAHQAAQDNESSAPTLNMSSSSGSSGVHTSWNQGLPSMQHFPHGAEMLGSPLVSVEVPRQNVDEGGPQFSMPLPERGMSYCPQATLTPSQMAYCQRVSPPQQEMIFSGPQLMPTGEPNIPRVARPFSENLRMPPNGLPVSACTGIPMMSHTGTPPMPYPGLSTVPSDEILLGPTVPSTEAQAVLPSMAQKLPPQDAHDLGMPLAESQSLLVLGSQASLVSQPDSQEGPFLPEQPRPAPQTAEKNSRPQQRTGRGGSSEARPYCCDYENCGKAYTKRSHLVSHQHKHTGERPYSCNWESCSWSFFRSDELRRHMRGHTRYRPYKCDQCSREFMRSDHLNQHQKTHRPAPSDPQAPEGEQDSPPAAGP
ncbi:Krueppel-like factor 17 [Symphalangus syndactylus]|uniref:Krueppel-like factor 17 n=1 Tax=Symphalangus syndactylus TaxID=9590 RepID=UPI002442BC30|nr:Krueppel-like factor 17 [Symphalangus syndactylus]